MEKTTLYMTSDTQRRLRDAARRTGRPQAEIVREAVERYLNDEEPPLPQSIGLGSDDQVTAENSEEWLRRHWRPE